MSSGQDVQRLSRKIATECVGARVRMINREVTRIYDDHLRPLGIRFSQLNILTVVALRGPVQPVEVSRMLSLEKSTLSRNLRILEESGWIATEAGASGHTRLLTLTRSGRTILGKAEDLWEAAQDETEALLGKTATRAVHKAAHRILSRGP